jgi:hypothetical protein
MKYFIFPEGIYDENPDAVGWTDRACVFARANIPGCKASVFDYSVSAMEALAHDRKLAARLYSEYVRPAIDAGYDVVIGAHSNGNRITMWMLRDFADELANAGIEWHIIAGWMSADCDENGLNAAAKSKALSRVVCYVSPEDEALGPGSIIAGEIKPGQIGKVGPENIREVSAIMPAPVMELCGHSVWVTTNLQKTLGNLIGSAA